MKPPFLQHLKGLHESRMGPRVAEDLRGSETIPPANADIIEPQTLSAPHIICLGHTLSG
jgi:hypothetical protein